MAIICFAKILLERLGVVNPLAADDEVNLGLKARYELTKGSHTVDMMGPIQPRSQGSLLPALS